MDRARSHSSFSGWMSVFRAGMVTAVLLMSSSQARAQLISLFNSNGFESPMFAPGNLGSYYSGGSGGQQGYLTTDFNQLLGSPAGTVQNITLQAGAQAFQINGSHLFDDGAFGGQTFWYRNYPTPGTAFNPVANGAPIVRETFHQFVSSSPLNNLTSMPLVGGYMEGYSQAGTQQQIGAVLLNSSGGVTAITVAGNAVSTANNLFAFDAWHSVQVDFNFASQTYRAYLDGNLLTFGASLTDIPFRNTNGLTDRIAEYGFQASYNEATMSTTNNAFFDNYQIFATAVPEPSSFALLGVAAIGLRAIRRRRSTAI